MPDVVHPGEADGLTGEAYAQWLVNYILWIDRERAATGGIYPYTLQALQMGAAIELNALVDDNETLEEAFYQQAIMAMPQMTMAAFGASSTLSGGAKVLRAVQRVGEKLLSVSKGANSWSNTAPIKSTIVGPKGMIVYRAHGSGRATGAWVTTEFIPNQQFVRESLAVKPEWNPATHASKIWLPPGTRIQTGVAGSQGIGYPGGASQIQILNQGDIANQFVIQTWRLSP